MAAARWWQNTALCKYYARAVAAVLVSTGLAGLLNSLGLNLAWLADLYHVVVGLFFAYAGFFVRDREVVRQIVEGLGVLMVLVMVMVIVASLLLGGPALLSPVEVVSLAVGAASILAAKSLRDIQTWGRVG